MARKANGIMEFAPDNLALELQETFLILFGSLIFYALVFAVVAAIFLAAVMPFLSTSDR